MDYTAFSHGQIQSKLWLCENLEPRLQDNLSLAIYGSWYNILGSMLLYRNPKKYKSITGIDIDQNAIDVANKITDAFVIDNGIVKNICQDVSLYQNHNHDVYISCSVEHFNDFKWYENIIDGKLICLQTIKVNDTNQLKDWDIKHQFNSLNNFTNFFNLKTLYFTGEKEFVYPSMSYTRYMIIGIK